MKVRDGFAWRPTISQKAGEKITGVMKEAERYSDN